jgi:membrane protein DedA with SNARE-associated domain
MQRGGQAVLRKRFSEENIARVERAYARFGFLTLAIPALLPPPMPFKIFVATAGALEYPRWRFMITIMIARSLRYYVEGILAVYYGRHVLEFIEHYGLKMLGVVAALCVVGLAIYFIRNRLTGTKKVETVETVESGTDGNSVDAKAEADAPSSRTLS